jgi:general secretion pathway protein I
MSAKPARLKSLVMISERNRGFTLIEVLVALAITIVAFMAMYGSMMYVVTATTVLQEKTIATWIALDRITELRISREFPEEDESTGKIKMAGVEWVYKIKVNTTDSDNIRQAIVKVSTADKPDITAGQATGALLKPPQGSAGCPPGQVCE